MRLILRRACAAVAITGLLLAAATPASALWTPPRSISAPHTFIGTFGENVLAGGATGTLAAWSYQDGASPHAVRGVSEATAPPGAPFGPQRPLPRSYLSGAMVPIGEGRVVQLILAPAGEDRRSMAIAFGDVSGRFGRPTPVPGRAVNGRVSVSGNAHGDVLVAWLGTGPGGRWGVWASVRFAGGRFSAAARLGGGALTEQVRGAIGRDRRMVVTFDNGRGALLARLRSARGTWGSTWLLGPAAVGTETDITPFVSDFGEVVVAWYETQLCEAGGCAHPAGYTRVAVAPASLNRFVSTQLLERDAAGLSGMIAWRTLAPVVVAVPWTPPVIAYVSAGTGRTPSPGVIEVSYPDGAGWGPRGGGYTAPRPLSAPGQFAAGLDGAAGRLGLLLTWVGTESTRGGERAVFAAGSGQGHALLKPAEQVTHGEEVGTVTPLFNPASRWPAGGSTVPPWTLAWTSETGTGKAGQEWVLRSSSLDCLPRAGTAPNPICG